MKPRLILAATLAVFSLAFWAGPLFFFSEGGPAEPARLAARDALFAMRRASADLPAQIGDVAVVAIDDESCARLGARWPWSRQLIEKLVAALTREKARVLALNLSFTGLESGSEESTRLLASAVQAHGRVVLGATINRDGRLIKSHPILADAAESGYLEKISDSDSRIRRSYLLRPLRLSANIPVSSAMNFFESSFPLKAAVLAIGPARLVPGAGRSRLEVGSAAGSNRALELGEDGSYTINYLANESDFKVYSAWKVMEGRVPPGLLADKVVFVGLASTLLTERQSTPVGPLFGVFLHANEYLSIAAGRFVRFAPPIAALFVSWLVSLGVLALAVQRRWLWAVLAAGVVVGAFFFGAQALFAVDWLVEPFDLLFGPALAVLFGVLSNLLALLLENKGLETKVIRDKMTGLYTYEYLRTRLDDEWKRCQKMRLPVAIAMTDLDRFKKINDTLGHEVGNQMILRAAEVIRQSVRGYDVVSRYGGDEFVILLWHSSLAEAKAYRERLRAQYHAMAAKLEDPFLQTSSISIGVASFDPNDPAAAPKSAQELVETADKDLFADKESRRKPGESSR